MGRFSGKTCRLITMLSMTFSFFLVELIFGHLTKSLALVSDSYHMLSDVVALVVGIACVKISKLHSQKNTYGWARAEVLGALVNSVFLVALCFTIFVEAIERLSDDEHVRKEDWMLYVGIAGLVVNLIGLALFSSHAHGHSHGGGGGHSHSKNKKHKHAHESDHHGHSHGQGETNGPTENHHAHGSEVQHTEKEALHETKKETHGDDPNDDSDNSDFEFGEEVVGTAVTDLEQSPVNNDEPKKKVKRQTGGQLNMRGVFLHVLGDALGSVVVIVSALIIKFCEGDWKYKVDPAMSMLMVIIILGTTIPLLKESAFILLQTVPTHIKVAALKDKLIHKVQGVLAVHEFHVWQLAGNRIIASAHIRCRTPHEYMRIAEEVKSFFHNEGIHSTTVQPEFVENS